MQKICEKLKQQRYLSKSKCLLINPMAFKMFLPTFYIFHHIRFRPGYLNWTAIETFFSVKENVNLKNDWTFFRNVTNIYAIFYIFYRDLNQWNAKNQLNSSDTIHHIINNNCSNIVIAQQLIFKKKKNVFKKWYTDEFYRVFSFRYYSHLLYPLYRRFIYCHYWTLQKLQDINCSWCDRYKNQRPL